MAIPPVFSFHLMPHTNSVVSRSPRLLQRGRKNPNLFLQGADNSLQFLHLCPEASVVFDQLPLFRVHDTEKITHFPSNLPRPV